jgi:outer membrane immunogenic protein
MMHRRAIIAGIFLAFGGALLSQASIAADRPKQVTAQDLANTPPSATFEFEGTQVRLLVGGGGGKGVLRFQGKDYPFTAKGASVGGIGVTEVHATGTVHYLNRVEDFAGFYGGVSAGATVGKGKGASSFENSKGVILSIKQKSDGLALSLGVSGFTVTLTK